jgi:hypothetical protein
MKYLKKYTIFDRVSKETTLFENLESKIDLSELESILIDFKQMGLESDIKVGSITLLDFDKLNKELIRKRDINSTFLETSPLINSSDIDNYDKGAASDSLTIEFNPPDMHLNRDPFECNIEDLSEAYEMLKSYLYETYDLIPNYIYINLHWNYYFFENFDRVKEYKNMGQRVLGTTNKNYFKAHTLVFTFYKD